VAHGSAQRAAHVSMAKLVATEAARLGARAALQSHGAIGYTWEQDLHVWMRGLVSRLGAAQLPRARVRSLFSDAVIGPANL
jgi:alkylation response protein AidB-like acyl-CoA dehydrogenase